MLIFKAKYAVARLNFLLNDFICNSKLSLLFALIKLSQTHENFSVDILRVFLLKSTLRIANVKFYLKN
jgi:hypothetical protein